MKPVLEAIVELHDALDAAGMAHAFGGALALLWCTGDPRGTVDVDVNVFLPPSAAGAVLAALPGGVAWGERDLAALEEDGQVRVFWDDTPLDVFLSTTDFHDAVELKVRRHPLAGRDLPFLACDDLAVFKAFFDRRKDWADLEAMVRAGQMDPAIVTATLARFLGEDDRRVAEVWAIVREVEADRGT